MKNWQQKRKAHMLREQLKFFGAKKQRFVSIYAKKPRIRVHQQSRVTIAGGCQNVVIGGGAAHEAARAGAMRGFI